MRSSRKLLVACGIGCIVGAQIVFTAALATRNGIRIHSPQPSSSVDRSLVVSGDAWMKSGITSVVVFLAPVGEPSSVPISAPAQRDEVRYRGRLLYPLSSWSAKIQLPSEGEWRLWARAVGNDGSSVETTPREVDVTATAPSHVFQSWSAEHIVPLALIAVLATGLGLLARRGGSGSHSLGVRISGAPSRAFDRVALGITLAVWLNELAYQLYWFIVGGWSVSTALMIQMCGLSILLFPLAFFTENPRTRQFLFDVLYFWAIGGAAQALISPDIGDSGFPYYRYFSFFISHGLIIASAIVMVMAGGVRITVRSLIRAVVVTNLMLVPIYGIDMVLKLIPPYDPGNYFVLGFPPPTGSPVDLLSNIFGPSPRYVVGLEAMGIVVFLLLYAPWPIARLSRRGA